MPSFQFFPSCFRHDAVEPPLLRWGAFNSFPVASWSWTCARERSGSLASFNSFPVASPNCMLHRAAHLERFQFFPSCFQAGQARRHPHGAAALSILSQLLRCKRTRSFPSSQLTFQFFPSCFLDTYSKREKTLEVTFNSFPVASGGLWYVRVVRKNFQFFPSCFWQQRSDLGGFSARVSLSILSQLLLA